MLCIRLQRTGRANQPTYRVVVASREKAVKGKFLEVVGHYLPTRNEPVFEVNEERITHWVKNGAIPSNTLARLLIKSGMKDMEKYTVRYTKQKKRKEVEEEEPAAAPTVETPAAETKEPSTDDAAPAVEEPAPAVEEPAPAVEEPAPAEESKATEEEPAKEDSAPESESVSAPEEESKEEEPKDDKPPEAA